MATGADAAPCGPLSNPKREEFCQQFLVDLNATASAERAGYSVRSAKAQGCRLMGIPEVQIRIQELMAARAERTEVTQDRVLEELWGIATADVNELVEYQVTCCRHCYGVEHGYQRTQLEIDRDRTAWERSEGRKADEVFREQGGAGFDPRKPPNAACQVCFGEGERNAVFKDTRSLSPAARRLYAGVKITKDGIEMKVHDKTGALTLVGKHLGMFTEKHEHSGPDGGPIEHRTTQVWEIGGRRIEF